MARPIRETPILFGEDARLFKERMRQRREVPQEEIERVKESYLIVSQWMENGIRYNEKRSRFKSQEVIA